MVDSHFFYNLDIVRVTHKFSAPLKFIITNLHFAINIIQRSSHSFTSFIFINTNNDLFTLPLFKNLYHPRKINDYPYIFEHLV